MPSLKRRAELRGSPKTSEVFGSLLRFSDRFLAWSWAGDSGPSPRPAPTLRWSGREVSWSRREVSWSRGEVSWSRGEVSWSGRDRRWSGNDGRLFGRKKFLSGREATWSSREEIMFSSFPRLAWERRLDAIRRGEKFETTPTVKHNLLTPSVGARRREQPCPRPSPTGF